MNRFRPAGCVLLAASLALTLGVFEVGLRLLSKYWLINYDVEMWRYARLIKTISTFPGVVEEQRPEGDELLMGVRVRTDAHGFRLPDPATLAGRRPDDRVVVALGDSLTFGWGVPEGKTYSDELERTLARQCRALGARRATVYNAGIGNCNTSMEVERYKQRIRPDFKPDWLILGFSYNDAETDPVPDTNPIFWHSSLISLAWARLDRITQPQLRNYKDYYQGLFVDGQPGWERLKAKLRELGDILRRDGTRASLALLPELHEPRNFGPLAGIYVPVRQIAEASGFEVIDASTEFPPGSGERYWVSREDAHPNAEAQALYARAIARSRWACATP